MLVSNLLCEVFNNPQWSTRPIYTDNFDFFSLCNVLIDNCYHIITCCHAVNFQMRKIRSCWRWSRLRWIVVNKQPNQSERCSAYFKDQEQRTSSNHKQCAERKSRQGAGSRIHEVSPMTRLDHSCFHIHQHLCRTPCSRPSRSCARLQMHCCHPWRPKHPWGEDTSWRWTRWVFIFKTVYRIIIILLFSNWSEQSDISNQSLDSWRLIIQLAFISFE